MRRSPAGLDCQFDYFKPYKQGLKFDGITELILEMIFVTYPDKRLKFDIGSFKSSFGSLNSDYLPPEILLETIAYNWLKLSVLITTH